ncbi:MAG: hypothetical protein Q7T74_02250 [Candidatus Saccharibacteria bacterium]|nr:hypothetical protein [Candidatus Saccharibacteria bacterium]
MDRTVEDMLQSIELPNRQPAQVLWADLQKHLPETPGSTGAHQAWSGGYADHITEVMNLAYTLYETLNVERKLRFSLSSALLVLFLHDCEKPFKNATGKELKAFDWVQKRPTKSDKLFQEKLITQYKFKLNTEEVNGLKYVEGEGDDYRHGKRVQGPLAAFCHVCDVVSARIWHDYPKENIK